jgi:hypothetical protein
METLSQKQKQKILKYRISEGGETVKPGMVIHSYNPRYSAGIGRRIECLRLAREKLARSYLKKQNKNKRA